MSINIEKAIKRGYYWKNNRRITYSMYGSRRGSDNTFDCSSYVYDLLHYAGGSSLSYPFSTESQHAYLKSNGFKLIAQNKEWSMKRGDVVIWGKLGQSAGAGGHTGICTSGSKWLECTAWAGGGNGAYGGIIESNHDSRWSMNGGPYFYVYRYAGKKTAAKPAKKKTKITNKNKYSEGTKVKLLNKAKKYQTGEQILAKAKNKNYTVKQVKKVNQSASEYAFLLSGINSWVLAQDLQKVATKKAKDWGKQYYTSNPKKVKLLHDDGLYLKSDIDFKKGRKGGNFKKGTVFVISGIKKRKDGLPRLVTQSGYLLTANKKYVKKV